MFQSISKKLYRNNELCSCVTYILNFQQSCHNMETGKSIKPLKPFFRFSWNFIGVILASRAIDSNESENPNDRRCHRSTKIIKTYWNLIGCLVTFGRLSLGVSIFQNAFCCHGNGRFMYTYFNFPWTLYTSYRFFKTLHLNDPRAFFDFQEKCVSGVRLSLLCLPHLSYLGMLLFIHQSFKFHKKVNP